MSDAKITLSAEDKTKAAFGDVKRNLLSLQQSAAGFNTAFAGAGAVLGSAFAGASFTAFVKATADGIDRLNDIKDATGSSIEAISGLEDVAARTGTSIDTVTTSLVKFNRALNDSKAGSANDNIFRALGLDAAELKRQDPAEALRQTAVALSKYADDGDKARVVQQLFGKSLREVAPFLNDLAQAGELNAKVTTKQAQEAENFNKQLAAMAKNSTDLARVLTSDLISTINDLTARLQTAQKIFGGFFGALGAGVGGKLNFTDPAEGLKEYNRQIAEVDAGLQRIREKPRTFGFGPLLDKQAIADLEAQRGKLQQFAEYYRTLLNLGNAGQGRGEPPRPKLAVPEVTKPATPEKPMFTIGSDLLPEALKEARKLIDQTDVAKLTKMREQMEQLAAIATDSPDTPGVLEAITDLSGKMAELDPEYKAIIKAQKEYNDLLERTPFYKMEKLRDNVVQLERAFQEGKFGLVGSMEAVDAFQAAVADMAKSAIEDTKRAVGEMDEFSKQAARNIQDALGDTLKSTLRGDFDNIGKLWGNLLINMAAEAAAAQLGKVLLGDFAKSGSIGGLLGDGLSWLSSFGLPRADGGPVNARSLQRVNERGFEVFTDPRGNDWLMTGAQGGYVTPNNRVRMAGAGGGDQITNVNITNQVGGGMQRGEVYSALQLAGQQIKADVVRMLQERKVLPA